MRVVGCTAKWHGSPKTGLCEKLNGQQLCCLSCSNHDECHDKCSGLNYVNCGKKKTIEISK